MSASRSDEARWQNRLGLTFAIDTNIVSKDEREEAALKRLHTDGWIELVMSDVTRTEWVDRATPEQREHLEALAIAYVEYHGALTLDSSRLDSNILGTDEDQERLNRVFAALWPNKVLRHARKQDVRDAMNVARAIRYGVHGFITRDGEGRKGTLLKRADAVKAAFNSFGIMSPSQALAFVERMRRGWHRRWRVG
jgi:hypothetical protein